MPWTTPSLKDVRAMTRDNVSAALSGAAMVPNSVLRVMSDAMAALGHLTLLYIDWLARQLLPDTAETEWLDRHGQIWLNNADGSVGRKSAALASGWITMTGVNGTIVPAGTRLTGGSNGIDYETTEQVVMSDAGMPVAIRAIEGGAAGNLDAGETLSVAALANVDGSATVIELTGGTDEETDAELRARVLERIQAPPMGGCQEDYVHWALEFSGVTRAWAYPNEMGIGTCTLRFMMDDLRVASHGIPTMSDVLAVKAYLDTKRPVAVKDFFCVAPLAYPCDYQISGLDADDAETRASIDANMKELFIARAVPGGTMWHSWATAAIAAAIGEDHHDLAGGNIVMPDNGHIPVLGTISYD